jgi:penicillin-binding protein 1A
LDPSGEAIFNAPRKRVRAIAPGTAYQVHSILAEYMEKGQGKEAAAVAGLPEFPVAGRPGTAYGFTDTYFLGYTESVTCGVWVGFDKPTRIFRGAFGKDLALPIWTKIMAAAVKTYPPRPIAQPPGLQTVEICRSSGLLATPRCQPKTQAVSTDPDTRAGNVYKELATSEQIPKIPCDIHGGGIRAYDREFNQEDWPRAATAIDLTKIRPVAVTSPALTGYNDVYRSVRPGEEAVNDDSIPVAKAIAVNVTPPAGEATANALPVEAPPGGIEIRRAEPVDSQAPPMEAPAIEAPAPDPIQFFQ